MGFLLDLASRKATPQTAAVQAGRLRWTRTFGATHKEEQHAPPPIAGASVMGGSYAASAATQRGTQYLVRALRSTIPGSSATQGNRYEQSKSFVGLTYIAVHRKAEQLAQAEFQVFKKDTSLPEGKRPISEDDPPEGGRLCKPHDLVKLLGNPNNADTFGSMMYRWSIQMDLTGMALTYTLPNDLPEQLQFPMELYPIETATVWPMPPVNPEYPEGFWQVQYMGPWGPFSSYPTPFSAVGARIPGKWMLQMKYPHPYIRWEGYSPLTALSLHIDELNMMDRSRHSSMRRSIDPSAVLNFENVEGAQPLMEDEIDRVRADFEANQQGPENAGTLYVAPPGSRLEPWGSKPIEMDYVNSWNQLVSFCLGGFGITKQAAGMIEDSSYSTLFATMKQFYWQTLEPQCERFSGQLTKNLAPYFGDDLIVEIRCKRIDDHDVNLSKVGMLLNAKAITKNEVRQRMDMPVTAAPWGDEIAGLDPMQEVGMGLAGPEALRPGSPPAVPMPQATEQSAMQEAMRLLPSEVSASRPDPGPLGQGAMGPRKEKRLGRILSDFRLDGPGVPLPKSLRRSKKSLYDQICEVMQNGH